NIGVEGRIFRDWVKSNLFHIISCPLSWVRKSRSHMASTALYLFPITSAMATTRFLGREPQRRFPPQAGTADRNLLHSIVRRVFLHRNHPEAAEETTLRRRRSMKVLAEHQRDRAMAEICWMIRDLK
ncbi:auxin-responsive GH3 family protein, partial [Striga asiatica]